MGISIDIDMQFRFNTGRYRFVPEKGKADSHPVRALSACRSLLNRIHSVTFHVFKDCFTVFLFFFLDMI